MLCHGYYRVVFVSRYGAAVVVVVVVVVDDEELGTAGFVEMKL